MWFVRRARAMDTREIAQRVVLGARGGRWTLGPPALPPTSPVIGSSVSNWGLGPPLNADSAPARHLVREADRILDGRYKRLNLSRTDVYASVNTHVDPETGFEYPSSASARFSVSPKPSKPDPKQVWELSRHHHLTTVAAAYWITGEQRYADRVVDELASWIASNPFMRGIHWTSGIELGIRLTSWAWIRRFLTDLPGVESHFEENGAFVESVGRHIQWLTAFPSPGSSSNNHRLAELLGLVVGHNAFPFLPGASRLAAAAIDELAAEAVTQVDATGITREMASGYQSLVFDILFSATFEHDLGGNSVPPELRTICNRMIGASVALCDSTGNPARFGDDDSGFAFDCDGPSFDAWQAFQELDQIRRGDQVNLSTLRTALWANSPFLQAPTTGSHDSAFVSESGISILRTTDPEQPELWAAFNHGALGWGSTAAHGHADALSFELRVAGQPFLVDPGCYQYSATSEWRNYFRSTRAHNTVTVDGQNQSEIGGPFLWSRHAQVSTLSISGAGPKSDTTRIVASHDGYSDLSVVHVRALELARSRRVFTVVDTIERDGATDDASIAWHFHLHPDVEAFLNPGEILLRSSTALNTTIRIHFDASLVGKITKATDGAPLAWYSEQYNHKRASSYVSLSTTLTAERSFTFTIEVG